MASSNLDGEVVADCCTVSDDDEGRDTVDKAGTEPEQVIHEVLGVKPRHNDPSKKFTIMGIKPRDVHKNCNTHIFDTQKTVSAVLDNKMHKVLPGMSHVFETSNITEDMFEDGAFVVFDWDNTLKLYDRQTRNLSSRVSYDFLYNLKHVRGCHLFIISAIRPSAINLKTILLEVEKLGLTDIFLSKDASSDETDSSMAVETVVHNQYAKKGNVIICDYNKAPAFLELTSFDSAKGHKVMFFDDEMVNIDNFSATVPSATCYHCI